jgi:hypothetical protein
MRESRIVQQHFLANRLEQMRFTQAHAAVNEQRVVRLSGLFGNGQRRRMRQPIAWAGDEIFEDVIGIERERLVSFIEDPAARKIVAVKADGDSRPVSAWAAIGEGLLALALAES